MVSFRSARHDSLATNVERLPFEQVTLRNHPDVPEDFPALDGLRAFAVSSVLIGHLIPLPTLQKAVGWGDMGVVLFFCLSGFLITNILLKMQPAARSGSRATGLKIFYARRFLRIFPIYYLTILFMCLVHYAPVRENLFRLLTYSVSFPGLSGPKSSLGAASHLWSLSVEEQFYCFWPLIVFFMPRRVLPVILSGLIFGCLAYKFMLAEKIVHPFLPENQLYALIFRPITGCLDSLGLGSLAAVMYRNRMENSTPVLVSANTLGVAMLAWLGVTVYRISSPINPSFQGYLPFGVAQFFVSAVAFTTLILYVVEQRNGILSRLLSFRPLRWIARISYGLYVYHFFMTALVGWLLSEHIVSSSIKLRYLVIFDFLMTFTVATLSWNLIEKPILSLKRYFDYAKTEQA